MDLLHGYLYSDKIKRLIVKFYHNPVTKNRITVPLAVFDEPSAFAVIDTSPNPKTNGI